MLAAARPFETLEPLKWYFRSLEKVAFNPTQQTIAELALADRVLTERAVLVPQGRNNAKGQYEHVGFTSYSISDTVVKNAREAVGKTRRGVELSIVARGSLIGLGGSALAINGGFSPKDIKPAYRELVTCLDNLGQESREFRRWGLEEIGRRLVGETTQVPRAYNYYPIPKPQVLRNIAAALVVIRDAKRR